MNKIIENFLIPLFVVVSALYAFNSFGSDGPVKLNKIYHHTTQSPVHLERANVSCYFCGDVQVHEIKNKKHCDARSCTFFFPRAVINNGECENMIQRLRDHNDGYTITITEVMQPAKGILIAFSFDNKKIALSYELFDSINLQKGIVFRLYNKELLQQLEQKNNQPVLRTLWHKPDFTTLSPRLQSTGNASYDTTKDKSLGRPCIAIDSGHGGSDCGAIGIGGIQEKDISLAIGIKVGNLLEQHGFSVVMTRNSDDTVGLDERTSYANNNHADLFVSIHANWASNQRAIGIETFCLKPTLLKKGFSQLSDAQQNLYANVLQQRFDDAHTLAQAVQHRLCDAVSHHHNDFIDRKVKYSVSQVLLGTQAPSILVEVGFVSHPKEAVLLHDTEYQSNVARGICDGILSVVSYNNFL